MDQRPGESEKTSGESEKTHGISLDAPLNQGKAVP